MLLLPKCLKAEYLNHFSGCIIQYGAFKRDEILHKWHEEYPELPRIGMEPETPPLSKKIPNVPNEMIKLLRMLNVSSCVEDSCRCSLPHLQAEQNIQLDIDHKLGFLINAKCTSQEERSQRLER
jgi:hypothetical protein